MLLVDGVEVGLLGERFGWLASGVIFISGVAALLMWRQSQPAQGAACDAAAACSDGAVVAEGKPAY